jgi:hypothetical protein
MWRRDLHKVQIFAIGKFTIWRDGFARNIINVRWAGRLLVTIAPKHLGFCIYGDGVTTPKRYMVLHFQHGLMIDGAPVPLLNPRKAIRTYQYARRRGYGE